MTDLELLDKFCETCVDFIQPQLFRQIEERGLTRFVNYLPNNSLEAKAVVRARLSKYGRYIGDPEIEQIASKINRLTFLRETLTKLSLTEPQKVIPVLEEMTDLSNFILNYFKPVKIP